MKKRLIAGALSLLSAVSIAQGYNQALGLRFNNYNGGITYKKFISETNALDFTLNADFDNGFGLTGLYEIHVPTGFAEGLNWYYGAGGHISLWSGSYSNAFGDYSSIGLGVDGVVGVEYVVANIPFAFSLDYIPSFSVTSTSKPKNYPEDLEWDGLSSGFGFRNWTLGIKYTFNSGSNSNE